MVAASHTRAKAIPAVAPEGKKSPRGGFFSAGLLWQASAPSDRKIRMLVELPPVPSLVTMLCVVRRLRTTGKYSSSCQSLERAGQGLKRNGYAQYGRGPGTQGGGR